MRCQAKGDRKGKEKIKADIDKGRGERERERDIGGGGGQKRRENYIQLIRLFKNGKNCINLKIL